MMHGNGMMPGAGQVGAPQPEMTQLQEVFQKMLQQGADVNMLLQQLSSAAGATDAPAAAHGLGGGLASGGQLNPAAAAAVPAAAGYGGGFAASRAMPCARKVARQGAFSSGYSGRGAMMSRGGGKGRWKQQAMPQKRISRASAAAAAPPAAAAPLAQMPGGDLWAGMGPADAGMGHGAAGGAGITDADFANLFGDMFE
jgi:hypothetical protein